MTINLFLTHSASDSIKHLSTILYYFNKIIHNTECYLLFSACSQVQLGVQAVFGPSDPLLGAHIHSICDALDIPHLEARLDLDTDVREFSINLYPAQHLLNTAFQDVMNFLNWTRVAIIYEEDYGKKRLILINASRQSL